MTVLHIDFETRSAVDLKKVGLHNYVRHPSTDVWCLAASFDDEEPEVIHGPMFFGATMANASKAQWTRVGERIIEHVASGGKVLAHNAAFELAVWNSILVPRHLWPELKVEQTFCTMAQCFAMALPGALEDASLALGLPVHKDMEGRALMLRFAKPWKTDADGTIHWMDECPEFKVGGNSYTGATGLEKLYAYCQQDVRVEREVDKRVLPLSPKEREVWLMDYEINQRGVAVDIETAKAAIAMAEIVKERCSDEIAKITDGAVQSLSAIAAFKEWAGTQGVVMDSIDKQSVVDLLEGELPDNVRRALRLRQEATKSSIAKLGRIIDGAGVDGRLRNLYQYHGSAYGRWAGRGVQVHNLPRDMPPRDTVESILQCVREGNYQAIDAIFGPPLTMISKCLRSFFVASPGKVLVSGDWANVESRGAVWFTNETWKMEAFRAQDTKTGPDVYKLGAARLLGCDVSQITKDQRQSHGKVPDLAFQYGGGVGSGKTMGKTYGVSATDEEWDRRKEAWRDAHPAIAGVRMKGVREDGQVFWYRKGGIWKAIEKAAIDAVLNPGQKFSCGYSGREAVFRMAGSFLWCMLPSGRVNCYPYPKILAGEYKPILTYMAKPGPDRTDIVYDVNNSSNWARFSTWGGTLFNNIVQGFCRDFLSDGMLALRRAGAQLVLHTHDDENIEVDVAKGEGARKAMELMMKTPPPWADGFPLFAECELMTRYGK